MISKQEAISIITKKLPEKSIRKYTEYSKLYVFEMVPKGKEMTDTIFFDSTYSVDKGTGMMMPFDPSNLEKSERPATDAISNMFRGIIGRKNERRT